MSRAQKQLKKTANYGFKIKKLSLPAFMYLSTACKMVLSHGNALKILLRSTMFKQGLNENNENIIFLKQKLQDGQAYFIKNLDQGLAAKASCSWASND